MLGPYIANKDGTLSYRGNNVFEPLEDVIGSADPNIEIENRVAQLKKDKMWPSISQINHQINLSANEYFDEMGALFTSLPLTTRMISSPGAVYGKEAISYTTDTCPIKLKWFDLPREAFLSESSQIYLEIALMQPEVKHVYSVYNSFRKEKADATHLSEFHHIEYEGAVDQTQNENIALGLVGRVLTDLLSKKGKELSYFLPENRLKELDMLSKNVKNIPRIKFAEALDLLYHDTGNEKYKKFTMDGTFGSWEEVRLTQIVNGMVAVTNFPLLEVPFYHAKDDDNSGKDKSSFVANNTDIIWPGYRETIGSGHRVRSEKELEEKATIFQLPREDYAPYLQTRSLKGYRQTSGFGLGWERMLHGLLEMPFIWSAVQFPRVHSTLKP